MFLPKPPENYFWHFSTNGQDRSELTLMYRGPKTLYLFKKKVHNTKFTYHRPPVNFALDVHKEACQILDHLGLDRPIFPW